MNNNYIDSIHKDILKLSRFVEEIKERIAHLSSKEFYSISKINLNNFIIISFKSDNNYGYIVFSKSEKREIYLNSLKDKEVYFYNEKSIIHKQWIDEFKLKFKKLQKKINKIYGREIELLKLVDSLSKQIQ